MSALIREGRGWLERDVGRKVSKLGWNEGKKGNGLILECLFGGGSCIVPDCTTWGVSETFENAAKFYSGP